MSPPFELFADIKFNKFGLDPISGTPLNFIEQLNQMFSDLVVLYAVEELISKYPDKTFEVNFGSMGYMPKNRYVGVDFANIGNRKIIINSFWIELPNGVRAVIQPDSTPIGTQSWPIELNVEESAFLPWQKDKFLKFIKDEKTLQSNEKLLFCVTDSTGVTYKCKTPKTVSEYLELIEKED